MCKTYNSSVGDIRTFCEGRFTLEINNENSYREQ